MRETVEPHDAVPATQEWGDECAELRMITAPPMHEVHDRSLTPHAAAHDPAERRRLERRTTGGRLNPAAWLRHCAPQSVCDSGTRLRRHQLGGSEARDDRLITQTNDRAFIKSRSNHDSLSLQRSGQADLARDSSAANA